jgi:hypothetical protein
MGSVCDNELNVTVKNIKILFLENDFTVYFFSLAKISSAEVFI